MRQNGWTKEELGFLKKMYGLISNKALASFLQRSKQSIQHKAHRFGLTTKLVATWKYCVDCGVKLSRASISKKPAERCHPCSMKKHSGEGHHNWKGGVSELNFLIHTYLYPAWKRPILKRDDFHCRDCGIYSHNLEVHHTRPFYTIRDEVIKNNSHLSCDDFEQRKELAQLIVLSHTLDDGISLCISCHTARHKLNQGELQGSSTVLDEGNLQPSQSNVVNLVDWKVQRLTDKDTTTDKSDTSALLTIPNSEKT